MAASPTYLTLFDRHHNALFLRYSPSPDFVALMYTFPTATFFKHYGDLSNAATVG